MEVELKFTASLDMLNGTIDEIVNEFFLNRSNIIMEICDNVMYINLNNFDSYTLMYELCSRNLCKWEDFTYILSIVDFNDLIMVLNSLRVSDNLSEYVLKQLKKSRNMVIDILVERLTSMKNEVI